MPKVTKKQKEKAKDFSKAKLKLGKGKQVANNATDTSFKARSIALPNQNPLHRAIQVEDLASSGSSSRTPTSRRGVTLPEVLLSLRHPNTSARKDALGELKEILVNGVELGGVPMGRREGEVGKVLGTGGVCRLVADEEASVRKALIAFLSWYLPLLPADIIPPHLPLLLLQISSALSHIFPQIRLDACRLINVLLGVVPSHIVGNWPSITTTIDSDPTDRAGGSATANGEILMEGLRSAIGIGGAKGAGSSTGMNLLPTTKLVTLQTILTFVREGLKNSGIPIAGGGGRREEDVPLNKAPFPKGMFDRYEKNIVYTKHPLEEGKGKRRNIIAEGEEFLDGKTVNDWYVQNVDWAEGNEDMSAWDLGRLDSDAKGEEGGGMDGGLTLAALYLSLHPLLLSILLEAAPAAFSPAVMRTTSETTASVDLQLCTVVAELSVALAVTALQQQIPQSQVIEVKKAVAVVTGKMAAWFPFDAILKDRNQRTNMAADELYQRLSLSFAELVLSLPPTPTALPPRIKSSNPLALVKQMEDAYGEASRRRGKQDEQAVEKVAAWIVDLLAPNGDGLKTAIGPDTYAALLPLVWSMLNLPPGVPLLQRPSTEVSPDESIPTVVGVAFLEHLMRTSGDSATRRLGNEFVARMCLIHDLNSPRLPFFIPLSSPVRPHLAQWLESLPRCLWEINNKDHPASAVLLRYMLQVVQVPSSLFTSINYQFLRQRLAPFFYVSHPTKGAIAGPWTKLSSRDLRWLALDVAHVLLPNHATEPLLTAVQAATKAAGAEDEARWQGLRSQSILE